MANLIETLRDMSKCVVTNEEKADYLLQHDVVQVVRCENCDFANKQVEFKNLYVCSQNERFVKKDDYCSYGERKVDNE